LKDINLAKRYIDILNGYSYHILGSEDIYIKHLSEADILRISVEEDAFLEKAKKSGLPTRKEKEEFILNEGLWKKEKDIEISNKKNYLDNLRKSKSKLFLISQIESINKEIQKLEIEINSLKNQKDNLIGFTAEDFARNRTNIYYIYISYYKDKELKNKRFSLDELEDLDEMYFYKYINLYLKHNQEISYDLIKRIAISDGVQSGMSICDENAMNFYGKSIVNLTFFQQFLFIMGKYYRNIFTSLEARNMPDNIKNDPEKISEWHTAAVNMNQQSSKRKGSKGASFIMGASDKDMALVGNQDNVGNINAIAEQKGGSLSLTDLAKIHGK